MARTQRNKATAKHLGLLKAKLAKLKSELVDGPRGSKGAGAGEGFDVSKSGDTRVGLIGFPSVGKSTLLGKLTGTESAVAAYEFTTLTAIPGTMIYNGSKIQVVDLPGIIEGAKDGKGRGRQVISTAKTCNVILIVLDVSKPLTHKQKIERELEGFGIRINKSPPDIKFTKKDKGGVSFRTQYPSEHLDEDTVVAICREYRTPNAEVFVKMPDATADDLIDVIEGNRAYMPVIYVLNKVDAITIEELDLLDKYPHYVPISADQEWNLDELQEKIWDYAKMTRIYTKPKGEVPDLTEPVIMHHRSPTVEMFCNRLHKGIMSQFKYAWVWGASARHQPQKVGKDHVLSDEDVVQIVKKV
jgi:small GTP-binding protein